MTLCWQLDQLQTSVRQLESERNQVLEQLREEQHERQAAQTKLHNMQHELAMQSKRRVDKHWLHELASITIQNSFSIEMSLTY